MIRTIRKLIQEACGATAMEFGMIVALIAVAIIGSLMAVGGANGGGWSAMANKAINGMSGAQ
jgi:Flp pilus assembly pilin Flp